MKDTNANWARRQIAKHGVDRYPTIVEQFKKLEDEVAELSDALFLNPELRDKTQVEGELADVALSLYNLADKLHLDLDQCIRDLVNRDIRKFE